MTEAAERAKREVVIWGAALALGLWLVWRGYVRVDVLVLVAGMVLAATGFALAAGAIARLRLAATAPEPGVVLIDEGRIGVFGPTGGGFVDLSTLAAVAVSGDPGGAGRAWVLRSEDGGVLVIPFGAVGAERIPDALASLPGLDLAAAAERAGPVWQAEGRERRRLL
ncbi:hypothetical protein [Amaricoccus sp.]|uniref:hypothetical protein n=1 Tax=Amaricoccus sp. TaxID=1872485 RepID=UPI001B68AAEB|nr:hypothetical protein [Amaricoccus sp.]MBP7001915.1 hypothetical protein [Amaricoccus sp.]